MAKLHGKQGAVLLNSLAVTSQTNGWGFHHSRHYTMTAVLGASGEGWDPGLLSGSVTLKGWENSVAGLQSTAVAAAGVDDALLCTILPEANTVGAVALFCVADQESFATDVVVTDTTPITINGTAQDGVDMGYLLHALAAETADGNGTGLDNTAGTTNGVVASLHVTAFSGFSGVVIKVQHSTDNSSWSDLVTFTTATTTTYERQKTTSTVNRYLRAFWDVTGSGSITFAVAAARR